MGGGGAERGGAAPAPAAERLPPGSVYVNSLWLAEEDQAASQQQGLKSLVADGAHLIACSGSSRPGDLQMRAGGGWRAASAKRMQAAAAAQASSPRIAAARPAAAAPASDASDQWLLGGFGSLLRLVSEQLLPADVLAMLGASGTDAAATEAPHRAAVAAAASTAAAEAAADTVDGVELQLVVPESSVRSIGQGAAGAAHGAADSPAHLIAAAPPAFLWEASPEAGHASAQAAAGSASAASPGAAPDGLCLTKPLQQAEAEQGEQRHQQQQADQQHEEGERAGQPTSQQQRHVQAQAAPPAAPQQLQPGCALQAEPSALSSAPSDARYSPGEAPPEAAPATSGGSAGSWQRDREEGGVRRSLAHPIFELQPGEVVEQQQRRRHATAALTGLRAAAAARWRPGPEGSPAAKAWRMGPAHIEMHIDVLAAGSTSGPQPPAGGSAGLQLPAGAPSWPLPGERQQQAAQPSQHFSSQQQAQAQQPPAVAPQYGALLGSFKRLDLARARRAVRAELKKEQRDAAAAAPRRSLLGRMRQSLRRTTDHSRKLRRELERERVLLLCLGRLPYNPDQPLHWELWQAVCRAYEGLGAAVQQQQGQARDAPAAWQALGFSAANPAPELGDTGVLSLLLLLLLAERAPRLAARLLTAAQGAAPQQAGSGRACPGFPPAAAAVEAAAWMLRALRSDELAADTLRMESAVAATECFWLGSLACFLNEWAQAGPREQQLPPQLRLRALLVLAEESVWLGIGAAVQRGESAH